MHYKQTNKTAVLRPVTKVEQQSRTGCDWKMRLMRASVWNSLRRSKCERRTRERPSRHQDLLVPSRTFSHLSHGRHGDLAKTGINTPEKPWKSPQNELIYKWETSSKMVHMHKFIKDVFCVIIINLKRLHNKYQHFKQLAYVWAVFSSTFSLFHTKWAVKAWCITYDNCSVNVESYIAGLVFSVLSDWSHEVVPVTFSVSDDI